MSLKKFQFVQEDLRQLSEAVDLKSLTGLKNKTLFLTGCSGFVGLWICELIDYLNSQLGLNILVKGIDVNLDRLKNEAPHLLNSKHFDFQRSDVRYLSEIPKETHYVFHCAGLPDGRVHATHPVEVLTTSGLGTESLLKSVDRLSDFLMFVNLSSALVYGDFESRTQPIKETENPRLNAHSPYAYGKLYAESLTHSYRQQYRIPAIILRPFTFLGPYQALSSPWAVNNFMNDALSGSSIKVLGTGQTTRSFLYGSDVAFWILKMALESQSGDIYNLGSPEAIDLKTAANTVNRCFTQEKEVIYCVGNTASHKTNYLVPDNSAIETKFKLRPTKTAQQAIQRTVEWYRL